MKVFEVTSERCNDKDEIITTVKYVTTEENTLLSVIEYFTIHCEEYEEDLKGIREVLVVIQHLKQIDK